MICYYLQDCDTILYILSKYWATVQKRPNVFVRLLASGQQENFQISEDDPIKVTTYYLQQAEDTVHLQISGDGCVLTQVS